MNLGLIRLPLWAAFLTFFILPFSLFSQNGFTPDITQGCSPIQVNFTPNVPGATDYYWQFGNGSFSNLANPGVTYINPGIFTVSLTVTLANGSTQTFTQANVIEVFANPQADFSSNLSNICTGEDIVFTDLSVPGSVPIVSWQWDFGDGTTSNLQNPVHTYTFAGSFTVSLIVTDANGCTDLLAQNAFIDVNQTPSANFVPDNAFGCTIPFTVNFLSQSTTPGLTHSWNFGLPGANSSSPSPSYTYTNNGVYSVVHIVSDTLGCADTVTKINLINVGVNTVNVQVSDSIVCVGEPITFTSGATPGSSVSWDFDFNNNTSFIPSVVFAYNVAGVYNVTASISDPNGCNFNANRTIIVNDPPLVDFGVSDTLFCDPPFEVDFTPNVTGSAPFSYQWSFGAGGASTASNPTFTYPVLPIFNQPYVYDISLIVTDANGCRATRAYNSLVVTGQTQVDFSAFPTEGCAPLLTNFNGFGFSTASFVDWRWDFGDGNIDSVQSPTHTYQTTGTWDVQLIGTTDLGCVDTLVQPSFIQAGDTPMADFLVDTLVNCASGGHQFTNLSTGATNYFWDFDDGTNTTAEDPYHQFVDTGFMDVMLVAFDRGCPDTMIKPMFLYVRGPIANASPPFLALCDSPAVAQFQDFSIAAMDYFWDFGDPTTLADTSNLPSPAWEYLVQGSYQVQLIVTNDTTGCADTLNRAVGYETIEAEFAVNQTYGCDPVTIQFASLTPNATGWRWTMGDGSLPFFGTANINHTYQGVSEYFATLQTTNSIGCIDDTTIGPLSSFRPNANFTNSSQTVCAPDIVAFTDLSTSLAPIASHAWTFGPPGASAASQNPIFNYTIPGNYNVTLTVTDTAGCSDSYALPQPIIVTQPIADFSTPYTTNCIDNQLLFTNLSNGTGLSYLWNFGDNTTSNLQNPSHTYTQNGSYTVSLIITDFQGCSDTIVKNNYILIETPAIDFIADTLQADCPPLNVNFTFNAVSSHIFNQWDWDFGDMGVGAGPNPGHIYTDPGIYTVTLVATAPSGCRDSVGYDNLIQIGGPTGDFTFTPQQACPGIPINFSATGTNVVVFRWDLGGGFLPVGQDVSQLYPLAGTYNPLLIVEDSNGCQVVVPPIGPLTIHPAPNVNFSANFPVLCDSGTVSFTDLSSIQTGSLVSWDWDFGDGVGGSMMTNPTYDYTQPGVYDIKLVVTSALGCTDSLTQNALVEVFPSPTVEIGVSDSSGCAPLLVQFSDISPASNAPIQSWFWTFGITGTSNNTPNPSYTYQQDGTFTSSLTLTDINGCSAADSQNILVWPIPEADFFSPDTQGCAPLLTQFFDQTPTAVNWEWDFGDNSPPSFDEDPMHLYANDGFYDVTLKVADVNGCEDSLTRTDYVRLQPPLADFAWSDSVICPLEPIDFTDLSSGLWPILAWEWAFGDGAVSNQQSPVYPYPNTGLYDPQLIIEDIYGCRDTVQKTAAVNVLLDEIPQAPEIRFVSVVNETSVRISFDSYANGKGDFGEYVLQRQDAMGNWQIVYTSDDILSTTFVEANLDPTQNVYCYRLLVSNHCESISPAANAEIHCTILLETTPLQEAVQLDWSAYEGWDNVDRYEVYRVANYGTAQSVLVATLPSNQFTWTDTNTVCTDEILYRIFAYESGNNYRSLSNVSAATPLHDAPVEPLHMLNVSVVDDAFINLSWEIPPTVLYADQLVIERNRGNGFVDWFRQPISNSATTVDDLTADVHQQSYQYRAFVEDSCGDRTPLGRIGTSIYLQAYREEGVIYLNWNPYEDWVQGVDYYELSAYNEQTLQYELIAQIDADSARYEDRITDWQQGSICYRITAWESGGNQQQSMSNEACVVLEPLLFAANAFSPNADGSNDRFLIEGVFIEAYELRIYNRWGRQLFSSNSIGAAWDGTADGTPVQEGVYVFIAEGLGYNGERIRKVGTVSLIR
ncbi:MAG: PKD domain-containing protein [Bacteroidota bacterium]